MSKAQERRKKKDESNIYASNSWGKNVEGFWNFMKLAFTFFEKTLNAVKKDIRIAILWGFGILLLVILIVTLVLTRLSSTMQLGVVVMIVLVLVFLFVYTVQKLPQGPRQQEKNITKKRNVPEEIDVGNGYILKKAKWQERLMLIRDIPELRPIDWVVKATDELIFAIDKLKKEPTHWFVPIVKDDGSLENIVHGEPFWRFVDNESKKETPYHDIMQMKVSDVLKYLKENPELSRAENIYVPVTLDKSAKDAFNLMHNKGAYIAVITNEKGKPTLYFYLNDVTRVFGYILKKAKWQERLMLIRDIPELRPIDWVVNASDELKFAVDRLEYEPDRIFVPIVKYDGSLENIVHEEAIWRFVNRESEAGRPYNEIMQKKVSDVLDYIKVTPALSRVEKIYLPVKMDQSASDAYDLMLNKGVYIAVITNEKGKPTLYFYLNDVRRVLVQFIVI